MTRAATLRALLLAALVLPAALAQAQLAAPVRVDARVEGASVLVRVSSTEEERVVVAVTHEDPILGTVVDRVLPVEVGAETRLDGLRFDAAFEVRVLPPDVALPRLADATDLLDGAPIPDLPHLGSVALPPLDATLGGHTREVRTYPLCSVGNARELHVTSDGHLVAMARESSGNDTTAVACASRDGGRAFGPAVEVFRAPGSHHPSSRAAADRAGGLTLLSEEHLPNPDGVGLAGSRWSVATYRPADGSVSARRELDMDGSVAFSLGNYVLHALGDGGALLAFDGEATQRLPNGTTRAYSRDGTQMWRLAPDGTATFLHRFPAGPQVERVAVLKGVVGMDVIGVAGVVYDDGGRTSRVWWSASRDGGASFEPIRVVEGYPAPGLRADLRDLAVDGAGALLLTVAAFSVEGGGGANHLLRVPPAGPVLVQDLDAILKARAPEGRLLWPFVLADGLRVWIASFVEGPQRDLWVAESLDGGVTFGPAVRIREQGNPNPLILFGEKPVALLPDGRPVLLVSRYAAGGGFGYAVAPLYDPLPLDLSRLNLAPPAKTTLVSDPRPPNGSATGGAPATSPTPVPSPTPDAGLGPTPGPEPDPQAPPSPVPTPGPAPDADHDPEVPLGLPTLPLTTPLPPTPPSAPPGEPLLVPAAGVAGGAAVLVVAAAATEVGRHGLLALGASLYARFARRETLRHPRREAVHALVRDHPGIRYGELRRLSGIPGGALAFHLKVLEREGYVASRLDWSARRFYPSGLAPPGEGARAASDRLHALVVQRPGIGQAEVARELGLSRQLASYHLDVLARAGRVSVVREGRRVRYHAVIEAKARP